MCQMVHIDKGAVKLLDPSSTYWWEQCKAQPGSWVHERKESIVSKFCGPD